MLYTKSVFGLSSQKPLIKVILMLFLYSNPIDSAQLHCVRFNNFLLSTWHPLFINAASGHLGVSKHSN